MRLSWWKLVTVLLLLFVVIAGLLFDVPHLDILNETIRNLYFHVPMWFGMITMLFISAVYSIIYLRSGKAAVDIAACEFANSGIVFGILGLITGMIWAKFTWGAFWSSDPKQNAAAIGLLLYLAYFVLRASFSDDQQRARVSSVYNLFCYPALVVLLIILPRMTDSLHPGSGGNPGFSSYDLDNRMRLVFYPAVIGFILLGVWITSLRIRIRKVKNNLYGIS